MKKQIILIGVLAWSLLNAIQAQQPCLPEGIIFTSQAQIDNFPINYPGCTVIEGDVTISGEDITNVDGLSNLVSIGGFLSVNQNNSLSDLSGFSNLTSISAYFDLWENPALIDLQGLNALQYIGGTFFITMNVNLKSLEGLESLTTLEDNFHLNINESLLSLHGLENLTEIKGQLAIGINNSLTQLSGLDNLERIGSSLILLFNENLADLNGLESLNEIGGTIYFKDNISLSNCAIHGICQYLENPSGSIIIENNAPGCNSQQEVEDACAVSVDDLMSADAIQIFPNPSPGIVRTSLPSDTQWEISVRDAMGRTIIQPRSLENRQMDLSALPGGLYYLEINNRQGMVVKRVVKSR